MTRLSWDPSKHRLEQGVDQVVLYLPEGPVPWNGVMSITETDDSSLDLTHYFDGKRHRFSQNPGNFTATLEAYTYPDEFEPYNGFSDTDSDKPRRRFGFSYRNELGSGHAIHLVWNAHVDPTPKSWKTFDASAPVSTFQWDILTTAIKIRGAKPAAHLVVDTEQAHPEPVGELLDILYGTDRTDARMPTPDEVVNIFEEYSTFRIVYRDDGTFTATGPDSTIKLLEDGLVKINVPSAYFPIDDAALVRSNWDRRRG